MFILQCQCQLCQSLEHLFIQMRCVLYSIVSLANEIQQLVRCVFLWMFEWLRFVVFVCASFHLDGFPVFHGFASFSLRRATGSTAREIVGDSLRIPILLSLLFYLASAQ